jgi:hypothetical protein
VRSAWWTAAASVVGLTMTMAPLAAHHSFSAEYDANKPVTLKGKVTRMDWTNPHCLIYIDVPGSDGKIVNWLIEAGAPNALIRRGWTRNTLPVGTEIVVDGYRAKNGNPMVNGRDLTFKDGRKLFGVSTRAEKVEITEGWPDDPK